MSSLSENLPTVVISQLWPRVECGRYPVKRIVGETIEIGADIFKDGHDKLSAFLRGTWEGDGEEITAPMTFVDNDRWSGRIPLEREGRLRVVVVAYGDVFESWLHDFERRLTGDQEDFTTELEEGRLLLVAASDRAAGAGEEEDARALVELSETLVASHPPEVPALFEPEAVRGRIHRYPDLSLATESEERGDIRVEHELAQFSAWYEFFPRSVKGSATEHATFRDCLPRIEDARAMGFDIVYFPPIHPIGVTFRKGKNNTLTCEEGDVGSPWAIGSSEGGHKSVEPALGTIDDFVWLVEEARKIGVEVALDFAIQCSPDHPYVRDHPEWFFHRPDGTIKYAENPPKKYQDIYPLNFHCENWKELWEELLDVVRFWVDKGVQVFRVDNPHTKPVAFWEWLIGEIHRDHPRVIYLSEAFTRPKMMQTLGKIGFTQSYTYFTWRVSKWELMDYVNELTRGEMRNYYRANFWPNTPDILPEHLQGAKPSGFKARAALAATTMTSWGIYSGYEFCENEALGVREEYLDSEKYQLKERDWNQPGNIKEFISRLNRARRSEPALREYANIEFVHAENDQIIAYYKFTEDRSSVVLAVVNLDWDNTQETILHLPLEAMGLTPGKPFEVVDLLYDESYQWRDSTNFVSLDPRTKPVHLFRVVRGQS